MKKLIVIVVLILLNCSSDDRKPPIENEDLLGKWRIIEQLMDPGDGSGTFQPVISDRTFEFFSNGTVTVNEVMCFMSGEPSEMSSGTYEIRGGTNVDVQFEGTISPNNCDFEEMRIGFNLSLDGHLILWYLCFESCGEKYEKIS